MEKMKELYAKVAGDSALQAKYAEIMKDAAEDGKAPWEKLTAFAKEAGYEISIEEATEYFKALAEQKKGELSDMELDAVAGGKIKKRNREILITVFSLGMGCDAPDDSGGY